ncbi:MAG: prepilin-type N-terminal cleavage/methylation domain-containing protein [Elusimicrobia bacterium]|nr:prepilin-type N-terminal cleavage/methylation domain-containing protein [Elusimicrobiota bacterium]
MAARQHRPIKAAQASSGEGGYTLVEVMVAMLLTSIMVTSVFSVALTVKTGGSKGESKIKAAAGARMVAALLKNYVTAETGTASTAVIPGPCGGAANNWSITCNGIVDACPTPPGGSACYALAQGTHTLTGVMGAFEGPPWNARVTYFVDATTLVNGRPVPAVSITTTWTDP